MSTSRTDMLTAARRYATAAFALAVAAKSEAALVEEISSLAAATEQDAALAAALANPLISREKKGAVLAALAAKASPLTARCVALLAANGRTEILPALAEVLRGMLAKQRGEVVAEVTSARPLPAATQTLIADALAKATGKTIQLRLKEDPAVLGGVAIQLGSLKFDATLEGALTTMRAELLATNRL